jgi:hypothetical protein
MIYIGHGHSAHNEEGNHLHYDCGIWDEPHVFDDETKEYTYCYPEGNLYTSDVRFGSDESELRWVWLYTCKFLNSMEDYEEYHDKLPIDGTGYVSDEDLKEMMTGAHIVMGYTTQSYLCGPNAELFGQYLSNGTPIIDAFFNAGDEGEGCGKGNGGTNDPHVQKVMYIPQTRYETIYSIREHYEYDASDVLIITNEIQDPND